MVEKDAELEHFFKIARTKPMFFAFVPHGATDGTLILSRTRIPPKKISDARHEISGGLPLTGKCHGPWKEMTFQVAKEPAVSVEMALKRVIFRETGLRVVPHFQVAGDADDELPETGAADDGAPQPETHQPSAPPVDPAAQETADPSAALSARLRSLARGIQEAEADTTSPVGAQIKKWVAEIADLSNVKDFTHANTVMDKIDIALKARRAALEAKADNDAKSALD